MPQEGEAMCRHTRGTECYYCVCDHSKKYGIFHFLWDLFMVFITGGLWLIWIFIREMRNR
jgi:hypothetical protein